MNCISWRHPPGEHVPARLGKFTCAAHDDEEERIVDVTAQLHQFDDQVKAYEGESRPHPDDAKSLETAVRWFFDQDLQNQQLEAGEGYRTTAGVNEQMDVVVTASREADGWSAITKVQRRTEQVQLVAHLEVAYRSDAGNTKSKLLDGIKRLSTTIAHHRAADFRLPLTGLVLLGPGWRLNEDALLDAVHDQYHSNKLERVHSGQWEWWPVPDVFVMPGRIYKKHDVFEDHACRGRRWPAYFPWPAAADSYRPLAIARGFLAHRASIVRGTATPESPAWSRRETAAIAGPIPTVSRENTLAVLLQDAPASYVNLWHQLAEETPHSQPAAVPCSLVAPRCNRRALSRLRIEHPSVATHLALLACWH